jgi:hypothetical protein
MLYVFLIIFICYILYFNFNNSTKKIKGGYYYIKKQCNYQQPDIKLENKNYIGKITGNKFDFRDLSDNYYCNQPIRI